MSKVIAQVQAIFRPGVDASSGEVTLAIRFLVVIGLISALAMGKVMVTNQCQQIAVDIDRQRSALGRSQIELERLRVERAMLRQPDRLRAASAALGLVPPERIVVVQP